LECFVEGGEETDGQAVARHRTVEAQHGDRTERFSLQHLISVHRMDFLDIHGDLYGFDRDIVSDDKVRNAMQLSKKTVKSALMDVEELGHFLATEFSQAFHPASGLSIEAVWHGGRVRQAYQPQFVRPGGTISGPTMMALADVAMYVGVLASIGPVPLAVTTNLNINFLRRPEKRDLIAECRILKLGKRLAVGEVTIFSDGAPDPVAHATSTYSIPSKRQGD
jgi:uncharacterized protein (TIGR00369 family)